ncbi:MAG: PspC domain-containing protein [Solirubrobacterales bacterium]|nr:PspC domain-containing protein [Solirubrobacterales bacterium]
MNSTTENKRLTRSRDDRFIGGVAAGIANHLNIDPAIVRIGFVISIIFGGIGVLAYLILLAAVPIEGDPAEPAPSPDGSKRLWVIGGTAALGILALVSIGVTGDGFGGWMFGFAQGFWFGTLIWALAIGAVYWLLREARDPEGIEAQGDQAAAKAPDPASTSSTTIAPSPTQNAPTPVAAPLAAGAAVADEAPTQALAADAPTTESPRTADTEVMGEATIPRSDAPSTFGKVMTIIAIVLAAGFTALVLASISLLSTTVLGAIPMASVVILLGIGLVVAALNNRHQLALWTLGAAIAIAIPMAIVSIADLRIDGDYGEVRERPVVADSIPGDGYQLAAGAMTVDMRDYPFRAGQTVDLPIESGLGATRVIVPDDVCVSGSVDGKVGVAEVRGLQSTGIGFDRKFGNDLSRSPVLSIDSGNEGRAVPGHR